MNYTENIKTEQNKTYSNICLITQVPEKAGKDPDFTICARTALKQSARKGNYG